MSAQLTLGNPPTSVRNALSARTNIGMAIAMAVVLAVGLVIADARVEGLPPSEAAASQPVIGTFAGAYQDGLPVYRLPAMEIVAPSARP
jgi:hypothetical protein